MPSDLPIACSLSGTDLEARYRDLKRFGSDNLIGHAADEQGHTLRFRRTPESERQLALIVAAEGECCSFLSLDLTAGGDEVELRITGPADARPVADDLAAVFE
jgi:hypothetical protein